MASHNNKVAHATEADWGFTRIAEVMLAIKNAARKAAREFEMVEMEDAEQDALLWVAVRPERVAAALESEDFAQLMQDIYSALRKVAIIESDRYSATVYVDRSNAAELGVVE